MKIGCNWSPQLEKILTLDKDLVDYIKIGYWGSQKDNLSYIRSLKPILVHGLGFSEHAGMLNADQVDFSLANRILCECNSPHYGFHLSIEKSMSLAIWRMRTSITTCHARSRFLSKTLLFRCF